MSDRRHENDDALLALLYDELPPDEADAARARLAAESPGSLERLRQWQTIRRLAAELPEAEPDPQLHYDLIRAARLAVDDARPQRSAWWGWLEQISWVPALAALGMVVLAAGLTAQLTRDIEEAPPPVADAPAAAEPASPATTRAPNAEGRDPAQQAKDEAKPAPPAQPGAVTAEAPAPARERAPTPAVPPAIDGAQQKGRAAPVTASPDDLGQPAELARTTKDQGRYAQDKNDQALDGVAVWGGGDGAEAKLDGDPAPRKSKRPRKAKQPRKAKPRPSKTSARSKAAPLGKKGRSRGAKKAPPKALLDDPFEAEAEADEDTRPSTGYANPPPPAPAADPATDPVAQNAIEAEAAPEPARAEPFPATPEGGAAPRGAATAGGAVTDDFAAGDAAPARRPADAPVVTEKAERVAGGEQRAADDLTDDLTDALDVRAAAPRGDARDAQPANRRRSPAAQPTPAQRTPEAEEALGAAAAPARAAPSSALDQAREAQRAGNHRDAVRYYEAWLSENRQAGGLDRIWFETAQSYEAMGDIGRALRFYRLAARDGGLFATQARARISALDAPQAGQVPAAKTAAPAAPAADFEEAAIEAKE